jgi:endogenous inhibitor of DNA gyrase (YacG/DUF329 family)
MSAKYCCYCGDTVTWKDNRGWYRDFCEDCANIIATGTDLRKKYDTDSGEPV